VSNHRVSERDLKRTIAIYEAFREKRARNKVAVVSVDIPSIVAIVGHAEAIETNGEGHVTSVDYRTTHGRRLTLYRHDFTQGSRPLLCVSPDGRQLLLLGGRYRFTHRGIVDRDAKDREIENRAHGTELDE
jgi:hypothetical protein